ncbi:ASKHA domain-containing protein [Paracoccus spongiarum]|uniref:ASKHA domain-containing protein n=1 Tax=Paracoccus spongiarum TaxID=3064387 RepID=A0ABT9JGV4_9RHOB|nr:ASKHA domain-containing protein [Paracoccus sp. 2205BS29-5]MDP5308281.1 ASKHA domain-containing protein [Paracoccus sp. 2205BS29-5]
MRDEPLVIFTPSGRRGRVPAGITVLEAARRLGVDLESVCGGRGICSRCQVVPGRGAFAKHGVQVEEDALSPRNEVEARYDRLRGLAEGRRLGCQARIQGDLVVDVPPESQLHRQVIRKSATERAMAMDPAVRAFHVAVAAAGLDEMGGDFQRLRQALESQWGIGGLRAEPVLLARIQGVLRAADWAVTAVVHDEGAGPPLLVDLLAGLPEGPLCGLAIDLGSTTIAGHLVALDDGRVLASCGIMNPQIRFGEDLMSRVSHAMMNPGGAAEMTQAVRAGLGGLVEALAREAGVDPRRICDAVLVGNPVMHHLLLGIDPVELGQAPFAAATTDALSLPAREVGLDIAPSARLYMLPIIAGHVGADAAAVVLAEAPQSSDRPVLIVDVGTNAEIILGDRTRVLACSSPTGPAFEGAQISCGQRAAPGAIERVRIDPLTKEPRFRVIGVAPWSDEPGFAEAIRGVGITGICGSGIIEGVAEMRMAGLLDASGLIGSAEQTGSPRCLPQGRTQAYLLHGGDPEGGPQITVTQGDIRAIQLAKSALYAGARLLMDEFGIDSLDRVVLAGAFGAHVSPLHALVLGMIPDCPPERVTSAGNAAGTGARMALCSRAARREIEAEVRRIIRVETALAPRFQEHFVAANAIPHATDDHASLRGTVNLPELAFNAWGEGGRGRRKRRAQTSGDPPEA